MFKDAHASASGRPAVGRAQASEASELRGRTPRLAIQESRCDDEGARPRGRHRAQSVERSDVQPGRLRALCRDMQPPIPRPRLRSCTLVRWNLPSQPWTHVCASSEPSECRVAHGRPKSRPPLASGPLHHSSCFASPPAPQRPAETMTRIGGRAHPWRTVRAASSTRRRPLRWCRVSRARHACACLCYLCALWNTLGVKHPTRVRPPGHIGGALVLPCLQASHTAPQPPMPPSLALLCAAAFDSLFPCFAPRLRVRHMQRLVRWCWCLPRPASMASNPMGALRLTNDSCRHVSHMVLC